ncbi:extensin [Iris pallida]|uniref:Extensin n=1 Tax=Iris pallida TaxID=29817 RepID=A0AAX6HZ79_IRIPA|nr:extensin [Iris pallida]
MERGAQDRKRSPTAGGYAGSPHRQLRRNDRGNQRRASHGGAIGHGGDCWLSGSVSSPLPFLFL